MRRLLVGAAALLTAAACINWDDVQSTCDSSGPCSKFSAGGGGGGDGGVDVDAGKGGGGGGGGGSTSDAGAYHCPGKRQACRGTVCWENPAYPKVNLGGIHEDGEVIWVVGDKGLIGCFDGTEWNYDFSQTTQPLWAIHGTKADLLFGGGSFFERFRNGVFVPINNSTCDLHAISSVWTGDGYSVVSGAEGLCEQLDGGSWRVPQTNRPGLGAITGSSPTSLWAAGDNNTLMRRGAAGWSVFDAPDAGQNYLSACTPDGESVWLGGDSAMVKVEPDGGYEVHATTDTVPVIACGGSEIWRTLNYVGQYCATPESCTDLDYTSASSWQWLSPGHALTSGADGIISRFDGPTANDDHQLTNDVGFYHPLYSVAERGGEAWAVGGGCQALQRLPDAGWTRFTGFGCPLNNDFHALYFEPDGGGWLAGHAGMLGFFVPGNSGVVPAVIFDTDGGVIDPVAANLDFDAISARGETLYVSGNPGVLLRRNPDGTFQRVVPAGDNSNYHNVLALSDGGAAVAIEGSSDFSVLSNGALVQVTTDGTSRAESFWESPTGDLFAFEGSVGFQPASVWRLPAGGGASASKVTITNSVEVYDPHGACNWGSSALFTTNDGDVVQFTPTGGTIGTLQSVGTPSSQPLRGLSCRGNHFYAVGEGNAVIGGTH